MSVKNDKREWSDKEVFELIHLYEEQEFLWNVKHNLYRNRERKMCILEEFASKFSNCDANEVQRKIHNLRNQVSHEMQKMKNLKRSGDGPDDRYGSKWKFFPALKFIVPSFTPTKSTSTLNNTANKLKLLEEEKTESEPRQIKRKIHSEKKPQTQEDDNILKEVIKFMKKPKDDFVRFGDYVALELKNLKSDYYRGLLKSDIRKAIARYSDIDQKSYWSSLPSTSNAINPSSDGSSCVPSSANSNTSPSPFASPTVVDNNSPL